MSLAHRFGIFWRRLVERAMSEPSPTIGDAPTAGLALTTLSALARTHRVAIAAGGLALKVVK